MKTRLSGSTIKAYFPLVVALIIALLPYKWKQSIQNTISSTAWNIRSTVLASFHTPSTDDILKEKQQTHHALAQQKYNNDILHADEKDSNLSQFSDNPPEITPFSYAIVETIFRESDPFGSALWVDIGTKTWKQPEFQLERYCPVLSKGSVVGYIDHVGERASRVLLITDPHLFMTVKVKREASSQAQLITLGRAFQTALIHYKNRKQDSQATLEKGVRAIDALISVIKNSEREENESEQTPYLFLAYGYLQGALKTDSKENIALKGFGFTCDHDHGDSPKRDLRTGQRTPSDIKIPIIKPGDTLETNGLDGIFPRGLPVGKVSQVLPLSEGDAFYSIEAIPLRDRFFEMEYVTILPARSQEIQKKPSTIEKILFLIDEED